MTTIPVFIISIFIMNILNHGGYIRKISWIAGPMTRFGHLHQSTGISFITAFGSPSAASAMLRSLHENGFITKQEVIIAVLSNAFPVIIMESRTMLPVMISFLGSTGAAIFGIIITTRFLQTMTALAIGRKILPSDKPGTGTYPVAQETFTGRILIKKSFNETLVLIKRIIKITVPVTFLIFTLIETGFFNYIAGKIQFLAVIFNIPFEGLSIVAAYFGSYMAAYTVAGNLLSKGILAPSEIILTVLTAKVLASIFFAVRHSTPYYIGIFGSGLGLKVTVLNTLFRNSFDIGAILLLKIFI